MCVIISGGWNTARTTRFGGLARCLHRVGHVGGGVGGRDQNTSLSAFILCAELRHCHRDIMGDLIACSKRPRYQQQQDDASTSSSNFPLPLLCVLKHQHVVRATLQRLSSLFPYDPLSTCPFAHAHVFDSVPFEGRLLSHAQRRGFVGCGYAQRVRMSARTAWLQPSDYHRLTPFFQMDFQACTAAAIQRAGQF